MAWHTYNEPSMRIGTLRESAQLDFRIVTSEEVFLMAEGVLDEFTLRGSSSSDDSLTGIALWARTHVDWLCPKLLIRSDDLRRCGHSHSASLWSEIPVVIPNNRLFGISTA